jgi:hypothetical protein
LIPTDAVVRRGQMTSSSWSMVNTPASARHRRPRVVGPLEHRGRPGPRRDERVIVAPPTALVDGTASPYAARRARGRCTMTERLGAAGQLAAAFIESKLTPLFIVASLALGAMAVVGLPREEEPQIIVPMVDVFVGMPGASPAEVEQRVTRPVEQLLWEVPGVEYIYSTSSPGQSMVIVRFHVGQNEEDALVRLNQKLQANLDRIPPGASAPGEAALDRRCAHPGVDAVEHALRRPHAAPACHADRRCDQGSA